MGALLPVCTIFIKRPGLLLSVKQTISSLMFGSISSINLASQNAFCAASTKEIVSAPKVDFTIL